jgi:hypothetical protein
VKPIPLIRHIYRDISVLSLLLLIALVPLGHSQATAGTDGATHGRKRIRAVRTEQPLVVDGSLDEPAWQEAEVTLGFIQRDPREGEPSTEQTEFRILYTPDTLYIGVICYDSNAGGILATERRRDDSFENDDTIAIVLDTFHDHRNAFLFRTNPLGAQYDALVTDEGRTVNPEWDEQWNVASRITSAGWIAEFAIPFKSLRVYENGAGWGLDLERVIRRKNEFAYWNNYRRGFLLENVSQAGHMDGLEDVVTGLRLRVKPYVLGGFSRFSDGSRGVTSNASDAGIEVMKYRITPSLTADMTWRTDFAQTEVDDQQVNLDRFPLFFPEKREFFQEGAGIFDFGNAYGEGTFAPPDVKLFHSRRIGLSARRQPVPIVGGGRITGRLQGFTLGLLNVQTEALPSEGILPSNYGVVRVKRDVLARSSIGAFLLNREQGGASDYNRVYGADANFVFLRYLFLTGFLAQSSSPGVRSDNWVTGGAVGWDSDFLNLQTSWATVDPDFRNDLGFILRPNIRKISPQLFLRPRPNIPHVRQVAFHFRTDYIMNQNNQLETRVHHAGIDVFFQNGAALAWSPHATFDTIREPFRIRPGVVIPPGTYSWWHSGVSFRSNPAKPFSYEIRYEPNFGYYKGGFLQAYGFQPRVKISEQFSVEADYRFNRASLPSPFCISGSPTGCGFTDHNLNTRINYNFNNQWLTSTTVQYNNTENFLGFNFRLNYIFHPGDDLFIVYNEGRQAIFDRGGREIAGVFDGRKDRSLQIKLTYSFDY